MPRRRVVITGLGIVAPNSVGKENFWAALTEGKSGIRRITRFDPAPSPTQIAGEIDLDISQFIECKKARRMDRTTHLAMSAAKLALTDSRIDLTACNLERIGVILATTMAGKGFTLEELEICACLLALEKGIIHPTINQEVPDPECDLNYVPNKAITANPKIILKNSFGFGGKNAALVIGKI